MVELLSQEYDGQISLVVPEQEKVEKQITGQISIEDVLAEEILEGKIRTGDHVMVTRKDDTEKLIFSVK